MKNYFRKIAILALLPLPNSYVLAADSSGVTTPNVTANTILTIAKGRINWTSSFANETQMFTIPGGLCPRNFVAYVEMIPTQIRSTGGDELLISYGVCIHRVDVVNTNYRVTYNNTKKYATSNQYWDQAHIYVNGSGSTDYVYGSMDAYVYTYEKSRRIGYYKTDISGDQTNFDRLGGINWTLYCYPPAITPPFIQSVINPNCSIGSGYF